MKRGFFRDKSHDERGGGDDGDGWYDEHMSHHLCLLIQYDLHDRTAIHPERSDGHRHR